MGSLTCRFGIALSAAMLAVASAFGAASVKPEPTVIDTSSSAGQVVDQSAEYNGGTTYLAKLIDRGVVIVRSK